MKVIFSLPEFGDSRFKSWSKLVTGVDTAQQNGYAFDGQFIQSGRRH